jgi:small subunit ribosomal protein S18
MTAESNAERSSDQGLAGPEQRSERRDRSDRGDRRSRGGPRRTRRRVCMFCVDKVDHIDYKDASSLRRFLDERGRIAKRRSSGTCAHHQRKLAIAIKRAREIALLPFVVD